MMVTVALPLWNGANIVWLQLESLCRQKTIVQWEIMMYECGSKAGWDVMSGYASRLKEAGCESVGYMHSETRKPLGEKWRTIAREANGEVFMLCAADNYSPLDRVQQAHDTIGEYDWTDTSAGLFYDIRTGREATWTRTRERSGLWMATKTKYIRNLKGDGPARGIDSWIRKQIPNRRHREEVMSGLHTDGANTISSLRRTKYVTTISRPFIKAQQKAEDILPHEIMNRLRAMA